MPIFLFLIFISGTVHASVDYQKQIDKKFRGFIIMPKSEFKAFAKLPAKPGLIVGDYDGDKKQDFAALIRDKTKQSHQGGNYSYDYYDGKLVACLGQGGDKFKCQVLTTMSISLPQDAYLESAPPGNTGCIEQTGKKVTEVKTEAVGYYFPEKAGIHYIYESGGNFRECLTSD